MLPVWSVHIRDCDYPLFFTIGKGASKSAGFCFRRILRAPVYQPISSLIFLAQQIANGDFVYYPNANGDESPPMALLPADILESACTPFTI
jgi:ribosomal protein S12 methylthiotransferase accessory factor